MTFEDREKLIADDWAKDAVKVRSRCEWLLGWGRGFDQRSEEIRDLTEKLAALKKAFTFVCQERNDASKELEIVSRMSDAADRRQLSSND